MNRILLFSLLFLSTHAFGCSIVIPITEFRITQKNSAPPDKPNFVVNGISRGERIRDNSSCSWLATMGNLSFKLKTVPKKPQGYIFEIVEGKLDSNNIFQSYPVVLKHPKDSKWIYNFMWSDGDSNTQEPFDIEVKITAVSQAGVKSKPQFLKISHQGVIVPWWNLWKKLPSFFTQAIEPDGF